MVWINRDNQFVWDAWRNLRDVQSQAQGLLRGMGLTSPAPFAPPTNVYRSDDEVVFNVQVPGYATDDIEIDVDGDVLKLSAAPQGEAARSSFERRFRLPFQPDTSAIKASLVSGVLEIRVPGAEADKPKKIVIDA